MTDRLGFPTLVTFLFSAALFASVCLSKCSISNFCVILVVTQKFDLEHLDRHTLGKRAAEKRKVTQNCSICHSFPSSRLASRAWSQRRSASQVSWSDDSWGREWSHHCLLVVPLFRRRRRRWVRVRRRRSSWWWALYRLTCRLTPARRGRWWWACPTTRPRWPTRRPSWLRWLIGGLRLTSSCLTFRICGLDQGWQAVDVKRVIPVTASLLICDV